MGMANRDRVPAKTTKAWRGMRRTDIACVMKTHGVEYLDETLKAFQDKCEAALKIARQINPQFAETIM
ncbi:hypothetical protein [Sinorhizobium meliloti]|uniref:hypothetical protein n=1 Tax=Rhizobium meliloti TaxID=382 RepID=UPI001AECF9FF|nr:hypothetical protein [Sinorhizobium meliloti]